MIIYDAARPLAPINTSVFLLIRSVRNPTRKPEIEEPSVKNEYIKPTCKPDPPNITPETYGITKSVKKKPTELYLTMRTICEKSGVKLRPSGVDVLRRAKMAFMDILLNVTSPKRQLNCNQMPTFCPRPCIQSRTEIL